MIFTETSLTGAFIVEPERLDDARGFFARSWCQREFTEHGLNAHLTQCNISFNIAPGTMRGMHFQTPPYADAKLVRCTRGAIYDVIVDLRRTSATYTHWLAVELTAENHLQLYVPEGFAHGFQTLAHSSEVFYQMSESYHGECASGVRWNDPAFGIAWPLAEQAVISERDASYEDFRR